MGFAQQFLSEKGSDAMGSPVSALGFSPEQAQRFVPAAVECVLGLVKGGGIDLDAPRRGETSIRVSQVDTDELASKACVDAGQATARLERLLPSLASLLQNKAGGAAGVLALLGGGDANGALGSVGKLTGKFFDQ